MNNIGGPPVWAVVGAQFGSEGKGQIIGHLARHFGVFVRTGGPNAGHTVIDPATGLPLVLRSIPCGVINPRATLVVGRGAVVDVDVTANEIVDLSMRGYNVLGRLYIDEAATAIRPGDAAIEKALHGDIASVGTGVSEARFRRMSRNQQRPYDVRDLLSATLTLPLFPNTSRLIWRDRGNGILLEGTQGFGLSVVHGPWPWVTSHDTTVGQLCADSGVAPTAVTEVVLVVRSFPIRVGGTSGPTGRNEISWEQISKSAGRDVRPEQTTVSKTRRRIFEFDIEIVKDAARVNGATVLALTFADYLAPCYACHGYSNLPSLVYDFIQALEDATNLPVAWVSTAPGVVIDRGFASTDGVRTFNRPDEVYDHA